MKQRESVELEENNRFSLSISKRFPFPVRVSSLASVEHVRNVHPTNNYYLASTL